MGERMNWREALREGGTDEGKEGVIVMYAAGLAYYGLLEGGVKASIASVGAMIVYEGLNSRAVMVTVTSAAASIGFVRTSRPKGPGFGGPDGV